MSLKWNIVVGRDTRLHIQSQVNIVAFLNSTGFHRRSWRRPKLKTYTTCLVIRNNHHHHQLSSSSYSSSQDNLFHALLSQLNSLDLLAPALGFTTALAILFNSTRTTSHEIGNWTLFTSPTPFNRFLKLRCASLLLLEDANERMVKEGGHLVTLDTGPIQQVVVDDDVSVKQISYQRVCVNTDDGGVVSLDWPANLELTKEHGLDTTLLIVPGTADGSMDENVRLFVYECLKRGYFPIVMNPRGCAGSPLTTPRLFTAADSDDVCTTVQFITRARPWTTLMGVGLGYGANMLTKYLAEVGEETSLTAATCLDNPFDLRDAARPSNHLYVDQNLTGGLIDILQSNKELFQGRSKGFDVEKALKAKSLKEFEESISMVSLGFDSVEEFYVNCSTTDVVGNIKIPLLFIQNNVVPSFSIPRSLIAENPFTSLLICTSRLDKNSSTGTSVVSWCQHLVLEWLMAIELGLLKGRHPLLEDTDVTINPSKRLRLMASKESNESRSNNQVDGSDDNISYPLKKMLKRSDMYPYSSSVPDLQKPKPRDKLKADTSGRLTQSNVVDTELVKQGDVDLVDSERGQVLQATEVVMNMLDVTMPEALSEEQKQKVLTAVGQGETLMSALQDAVPEDVRGKLTSSVTAILQNQKKNLNGLSGISRIPDGTSVLNTKMQENTGVSSREKELNTPEHNKGDTSLAVDSNNRAMTPSGGGEESEAHTLGNSGKSDDNSRLQSRSHHGGDTNTTMTSLDELGSDHQSAGLSKEKASQSFHFDESDSNGMPNISSKAERSGSSEDQLSEQVKLTHEGQTKAERDNQQKEEKDARYSTDQKSMGTPTTDESSGFSKEKAAQSSQSHESDSSGMPNLSSKAERSGSPEDQISEQVELGREGQMKEENNNQQKEEKDAQYSTDQKSMPTPSTDDSSSSPSSPEKQLLMAKEDGENQPKEESSPQPVPSNSSSNSPSFSVSQALDALTGMDDSTQVAVNSVFSVIEDVITQLEGNRDDESAVCDKKTATDSESKKHQAESESNLQQKEDGTSINMTKEPNELSNHQRSISISKFSREKEDEVRVFQNDQDDIGQHSITKLPYMNTLYEHYVQSSLLSNMKNVKSLESDSANALFLDYVPEEGQWKLLGQSGDDRKHIDGATSQESIDINVQGSLPSDVECNEDIIEPAHVILDAEGDLDPIVDIKTNGEAKEKLEIGDGASLMQVVKETIFKSLKVEVCRRIRATDMMDMAPMLKREIEQVANAVSLAVVRDKQHRMISWDDVDFVGPGTLHADRILDAISSAVQGTRYMKEVIPVGIVVGCSLASLKEIFNNVAVDSIGSPEVIRDHISDSLREDQLQGDRMVTDGVSLDKVNQNNSYSEDDEYEEKDTSSSLGSDTVMVGAVTAALGASALLVHQQDSYGDGLESSTASSLSFNEKENYQEPGKLEEQTSKSSDNNIVTSLAEKAMLVAGPVVPKKEGGELDQDRLVALLADLGQKGGILKLVGKVALLWGGIRGAMSLTGKLIFFLRLAERPLYQRILGFVSMVLVLWTPVVVPLLPTLVQNWTNPNSSKFAELACIIGLYSSIMLLVMLWGQRIRGYDDPLMRYGLQLTSTRQIQTLLCGFIGGVILVMLIQFTNVLLGFVCISWPTIPSSTDAVTLLKLFGRVLRFICQGLVTTVSVALVEELLFRSWLPEEIAADLGFNQGIILSGLAFSLSQWSLKAIPGLWLLSLGLAGVRQRCQGSLSLPIGLRAGIMASSFVLKEGGFLSYQPTYPLWVNGGDPFQPFNSIVGLAVALLWAVILYPREPQNAEILKQNINE